MSAAALPSERGGSARDAPRAARLGRVDLLRVASALLSALTAIAGTGWLLGDLIDFGFVQAAGLGILALLAMVAPAGAGLWRAFGRWQAPISRRAPALLLYRDALVLASGVLTALALGTLVSLAIGQRLAVATAATRFEGMTLVGQAMLTLAIALALMLVVLRLPPKIARWRIEGRLDGQALGDAFEVAAGVLSLVIVLTLLLLAAAALLSLGQGISAFEQLGRSIGSDLVSGILVLCIAPFIVPPVYLVVRLAGARWARGEAEPSTLWIVSPRHDEGAERALARRLVWRWPHGPVVVLTPPEARAGGEALLIAERLNQRAALFPANAAQLEDWRALVPPPAGWWGLPVREWHPPRRLMPEAVRRHLGSRDALLLLTGDAEDVHEWQDLARHRICALDWLADGSARPASAFDDAHPELGTLDSAFFAARHAGTAAGGAEAAVDAPAPRTEPAPISPAARRARLRAEIERRRAHGDEAGLDGLEAELAQLLYEQGELRGALEMQRRVLAVRRRDAGPQAAITADAMLQLQETLFDLDEYAESMQLADEAYEVRRAQLGERDPKTLAALNNRGASLWGLRRYEEARQVLEQALRSRTEVLGPNHRDTLSSENNLIQVLIALDQLQDALARRESQLLRCRSELGKAHVTTLIAECNLGALLSQLGRHEEAVRMHWQCLEARVAVLGAEHPDTLISHSSLGQALFAAGQPAEARKSYQRALDGARRRFGDTAGFVVQLKNAIERIDALATAPAVSPEASDDASREASAEASTEVPAPTLDAPAATSTDQPPTSASEPAPGAAAAMDLQEARLREELRAAYQATRGPIVPRSEVEWLGETAERLATLLAARGEQPVDLWQTVWGTRRSLMANDADALLWSEGLDAALALARALRARGDDDDARRLLDEAWTLLIARLSPYPADHRVEPLVHERLLAVARMLAELRSTGADAPRALQELLQDLMEQLRRPGLDALVDTDAVTETVRNIETRQRLARGMSE